MPERNDCGILQEACQEGNIENTRAHRIDDTSEEYMEFIQRSRNIETVQVGKMPGRSVTIYDKTKEILAHKKNYWWDIWGINKTQFDKSVWRVELRAGKKELNTWNLKNFGDFEEKAYDILSHIANSTRYVTPNPSDTNKARWKNAEFWDDMQATRFSVILTYIYPLHLCNTAILRATMLLYTKAKDLS